MIEMHPELRNRGTIMLEKNGNGLENSRSVLDGNVNDKSVNITRNRDGEV